MKYIFDFDDVLFNNTAQFKKHMFGVIADAGVPEDVAKEYYKEVRVKEFSLRNFITTLFSRYNIKADIEKTYISIMVESSNFINEPLVETVRKIGKENCYIITNGEREFNQDKIRYSGIESLFRKIYIVPGSKKEIIAKICTDNPNEDVFFIDDKKLFIDDIDLEKCRNLKTILYQGQDII